MIPRPTTILLAIVFGAAAANAADSIQAPPEIIAAAKLSGELARDVMDFGPRCRIALVHDLQDKTPCEIVGRIAHRMQAPADTLLTWLRKIQADGVVTVTGLPDTRDAMNEAREMLDSLVRLNSYGAQQ